MENKKPRLVKIILIISIALNIYLGLYFLDLKLNSPRNRIGVLTKDVFVGNFMGKKALFKLPKGITVRDASPQFLAAFDLFEPHRFSVVFTSDDDKIINYNAVKDSISVFGECYSIDIEK